MSQTILNLEEARELEARYATRLGEDALMRRAGAAAAAFLKPIPRSSTGFTGPS